MTDKKQIFLSYGRGDDPEKVKQVAVALNNQEFCKAWYDKFDLPAVTQFTDEIATAIENSEYLVLFIGDHALDSEWCEREWRHALNHCIPIIPVLIKGTWGDIGDRLPKRIRNINGVDATTLPIETVISEILRLTSVQPAPLCDVQFAKALPTHYIPRDTYLDEMKQAIGIGDRTAKDVTKTAGYVGVGGIGKTTLANALAQDCESRRTFDYIFWLTLGENVTANDANRLLYQIGETFGDAREDYQDLEKARAILSYHLRDKHTLIVLDDAWKDTQDLIRAFQFPNMDCRLLITTRSQSLLADLGARAVSVDKLTVGEGVQLMHAIKPYVDEAQKAVYAEIVTFLDGHTLAVELASAQLNFYPPDRLLERLKKNALEANPFSDLILDDDDRNASLERSLQLSYGDLGGDDPAKKADLQRRFRGLGIFAPNSTYPPEALMAMWDDADDFDAEEQAVELVKIGLLGRFGLRFGHHSLLTAYAHALLLRADEKEVLFPKYADWYTKRAEVIFDLPIEQWDDNNEISPNSHDIVNIKALGGELMCQTQNEILENYRILDFAYAISFYAYHRIELKIWDWIEKGMNAAQSLLKVIKDDEKNLYIEKQYATLLTNISAIYSTLGDTLRALDYLEQSLLIMQTLEDGVAQSTVLNNMSALYSTLGDVDRALECLQRALTISQSLNDKAGEARILSNIGTIYRGMGDLRKSLEYYQESLTIRRLVEDKLGEASTLNNIGLIYDDFGDTQKALAYYRQALSIRETVGDKAGEANTLSSIGAVYFIMGDIQKALECCKKSLFISENIGDKSSQANILNNIASIYHKINDIEMSLKYYNYVLSIYQEIKGKVGEATTLNNIGFVYSSLGEMQKAIGYYEQALSIYHDTENKSGVATILNNIAGIYYATGEIRKALESHERALAIVYEIDDKMAEAITLNNIGGIFRATGDLQKALEYYQQSLKIFIEIEAYPSVVTLQINIAVVLDELDRLDEAIEWIQKATNLMHNKQLLYEESGATIEQVKQILTRLKHKQGS